MPKKVKYYGAAEGERDTYEAIENVEKEKISKNEIFAHWEARAKREGVQSVMSARHTPEENEHATKDLQDDIFGFLGDLVRGKVFELGVGIGRMTYELTKVAEEVVGIDLSTKMLERARDKLRGFENVRLYQGRICEHDFGLPERYFDLVFESIVLLHILDPVELTETVDAMKRLSDRVFVLEHVYEDPNFPISKYSILRKPEEYIELFRPYRLAKQKTHYCAGDRFMMMLFENPCLNPSSSQQNP